MTEHDPGRIEVSNQLFELHNRINHEISAAVCRIMRTGCEKNEAAIVGKAIMQHTEEIIGRIIHADS